MMSSLLFCCHVCVCDVHAQCVGAEKCVHTFVQVVYFWLFVLVFMHQRMFTVSIKVINAQLCFCFIFLLLNVLHIIKVTILHFISFYFAVSFSTQRNSCGETLIKHT